MPTLQFKGKNIIWNHHLSVPYHTLEEVEDLHFQPEKGNGNLIIEGDNLIALKALLPEYAGKVKCIYIDPPYNTGNEGWVYNDNVNSPLINEWLGKVVGTDDLTRHDKWLCMMTPRLKMLRDLLSEDGVIFVSIDDNEVANLKVIFEEIFGQDSFVGTIGWESKTKSQNTKTAYNKLQPKIEYILCYTKDSNKRFNLITKGEKKYNELDEKGVYRIYQLEEMSADGVRGRNTMIFPVLGILPGNDKQWKLGVDSINQYDERNDIFLINNRPHIKIRPDDERSEIYEPFWGFISKETGTAETAKKELNRIFGELKHGFETVKPVDVIKKIIFHSTNKESIILDSFAGSGTTMHAINELNKEDGGNRKCILVQMKEYSETEPDKNICQNITRERNKLAIEKSGYESGFKYLKVGTAIDPEKMLEGQLPTYEQFAKYIYYLGTGEYLADAQNINAVNHFVGTHGAKAFYLIYVQDVETLTRLALNLSIAEDIVENSPNKRRIIYAPACFLDSDYMEEKQIEFVSIPYNLFERQAN